MFIPEFQVKGKLVKGQIIGNWSNKSYYAIKFHDIGSLTLDEKELGDLIVELQVIREKIIESNIKQASM